MTFQPVQRWMQAERPPCYREVDQIMKKKPYRLCQGYSPNGEAVHPYYRIDEYWTLADAQISAGRNLRWEWIEERNVWRAETGYEEAAEIELLLGSATIVMNVSSMG